MTAADTDVAALLEQMKAQVAALTERLGQLEGKPARAAEPAPAAAPGISEEELLAIAAALGAFLGVRVHIKQIRLLSSHAWAQQGRVSIMASHRLHT